jgi:integrase
MDERLNEEKQADVITVAKGTGMRRVELQRLRPELLEIRDGKAYVSAINGKNGLIRKVPVLEKYQEAVIAVFETCKTEKVFPGEIPTYIDIHSYRGGYAKEMYEQVLAKKAVTGEDVSPNYHTRGEIRISLNKAALSEVSKALGHKRISVSVAHYLKHHFA